MNLKPALVAVSLAATLGATAPAPQRPEAPAPRMAAGNGAPWLKIQDRKSVPARYRGAGPGRQALDAGTAEARSLASADFDEDGMPDVVAGYAAAGSGLFVLHRGNVDAVYPNAPEAQERKKAGTFTGAAFLPDADVFDTPGRADFIGAGDFDADGHWDVVTAARGGEALFLHLGDGEGGFAEAEWIALPGRLTALVTGEINRRDGLTDIVVGVNDASGPRALVFEGPDGALRREPEILMLPSPATDFVLERLGDGSTLDLAVAAGKHLVVVKGRDRKLSYELPKGMTPPGPAEIDVTDLPFEIEALAVGDFDGNREKDLALLDTDGALHVRPVKEASRFAEETPADRIGTPAAWKGTRRPPATEERRARLLAVRMSTLPGDDLVLVDRPGRKLHVRLAAGERNDGPHAEAMREAAGTWAGQELPSPGAAVLPMRLNLDALTDLAILSEGASGIEAFEPGIESTFTVTNTNDSGVGSLRDAIDQANALAGADTIAFNIPGSGPHAIKILSPLPSIDDSVAIDGTSQPGYSGTPLVEIDGQLFPAAFRLLVVSSGGSGSLFRGLAFSNLANGSATGGLVFTSGTSFQMTEGCFFGTNPSGTVGRPLNAAAISMTQSDNVLIGGTTAAARNLISASGRSSVGAIEIVLGDSITVQGNAFGTDAGGFAVIENQGSGVKVEVTTANVRIGGTTAGAGNVFASSLGNHIWIVDSMGTLIQGNSLGVASDGITPLPCSGNCNGILVQEDQNTTIGGTTPAARNLVVGTSLGIGHILAAGGILVQGNYVGVDATGNTTIPNSTGIGLRGVGDVVGGTALGAGNVVSGSFGNGILADGSSDGATIQGNRIGTNAAGNAALGNRSAGIRLETPDGVVGGSAAGAANLISGNAGAGVEIATANATGVVVEGNLIGTDVTGAAALGNATGVRLSGGAHHNNIGTGLAGGNVISGNGIGIELVGTVTTVNTIEGNLIGTNAAGTAALGNTTGVRIGGGANKTHVGVDASRRNLISGNTIGVCIVDPTTTGNFVQGNYIGTDAAGLSALGNTSYGVEVENAPGNVIGGSLPGERNVISGNATGVSLREAATATTLLKGNYIGTTSSGEASLGNTGSGLEIIRSGGNEIGGPGPGDRNVFARNSPNLWLEEILSSAGVAGNTFENNYFGLSASGATVLGNGGSSILWFFTDGTIFKNNVVVGASFHGLRLGGVTGSQILGNLIGITPGFTAAGNGRSGIWILGPGSDGNFIGSASTAEWNAIANNGEAGIRIDTGNVRNAISGNYIFDNGGLGIDLENDGVTANDPGDGDTGANNRQNFPVITSATTTSGSVTVSGTIDSTPGSTFAVQVYRNMSCDPSGHGEGLERIGTAMAMTDGSGAGTFSGTFTAMVPDTELLTTLATDLANGDTSEFSMCGALTGVPPAPPTAGAFSPAPGASNVLTWPESPGATSYHVYVGSRQTTPLLASASMDACEVGTTTTTSFTTAHTDIPPPGEMLWYLIRPEGPFGLGDVGDASSGPRSQESIGACEGSCAHDTCTAAGPLTSPCSPCVAMIAAADPFCVTTAWDGFCVQEVRTVCGSLRCPESRGTCGHPLCEPGAPLTAGCDAPPLPASCVAEICAVDPFCCTTAWDGACVNEVATVCTLGCL